MRQLLHLKPDKVATVAFRHPWVFSGAVDKRPESLVHGALVHVTDSHGKILGTGTFSNRGSIAVRVFEFDDAVIDQKWMEKKFREAQTRRATMGYGPGTETTGYRVLFGESDSVPGLIIDRYEDIYVMQLSTTGIDQLRPQIIAAILETFKPSALVERSDISTRHEEGLEEVKSVHYGTCPDRVEFRENGLKFSADPMNGQKTGFDWL